MILNESNGFKIGTVHYSPVFGKYYKITDSLCEEITKDEYDKARDCGRPIFNSLTQYDIEEAINKGM